MKQETHKADAGLLQPKKLYFNHGLQMPMRANMFQTSPKKNCICVGLSFFKATISLLFGKMRRADPDLGCFKATVRML